MALQKGFLEQRQSLPLEGKVAMTKSRIREWYEHFDGDVYVSISGGKDSTVLLDIVRSTPGVYDVPAVFVDTGLEYPEVRSNALKLADVVLKPKMTFKEVIETYGYPVAGKRQSRMIRDLQNETESNFNVCNLHRTGYTRDGRYCPTYKLADRWIPLVDSGFKISEQCCDVMKKDPVKQYERETGRKPIIGTMASESTLRKKAYEKNGCNAFGAKRPSSTPIGFWTDEDILQYIKTRGLEIPSVYGDIVEKDGSLELTGCKRTGCMFCMFGVQMEKYPNRFQQMQVSHPKQYDYCMNKLGLADVLDFIGIAREMKVVE